MYQRPSWLSLERPRLYEVSAHSNEFRTLTDSCIIQLKVQEQSTIILIESLHSLNSILEVMLVVSPEALSRRLY